MVIEEVHAYQKLIALSKKLFPWYCVRKHIKTINFQEKVKSSLKITGSIVYCADAYFF